MIERWQDYECPTELNGHDLDKWLEWGEWFHCSWCGKGHRAGVDAKVRTYVRTSDGITHFGTLTTVDAQQR